MNVPRKSRSIAIIAAMTIFVGCASAPPNEMISRTYDENGVETKVHYSAYMELEHRSTDRVVLSRLVVSLGPERVPPGYRHAGPFAENSRNPIEMELSSGFQSCT